mmetsp:Transcript_8365/g.17964  ORF Transcript_8365/g.17964 Transcript_8365/m.17964 type:complete len:90 (-) Transcript_8365:162-431(-)
MANRIFHAANHGLSTICRIHRGGGLFLLPRSLDEEASEVLQLRGVFGLRRSTMLLLQHLFDLDVYEVPSVENDSGSGLFVPNRPESGVK